MIAEFVVVFRELFEISLVVGIMLAFLKKTGNVKYTPFVTMGVIAAFIASVAFSFSFSLIEKAFMANEPLFEGVMLVLTALLVSWLVTWLARNENAREHIHKRLGEHVSTNHELGIAVFAFIAVFREGMELILFLAGISVSTGSLSIAGALLGAIAALILSYLVFTTLVQLNFRLFFRATAIILILLAAGLLSQGVHELEEANVIPSLIEHVYDFTPALVNGQPAFWAENGVVGSVLKGLAGYDLNPSLSQALAYAAYLTIAFSFYWKTTKKEEEKKIRKK